MEIGNQYKKDDAFKAAARLHQSKFRANVLGVDYNEYGNRLVDEDAKEMLNYYEKLNCRASLKNRYPSYSKKRDADMLRSEHIPFNLLAPLELEKEIAVKIINTAFNLNISSIEFIGMEYAPSPKNEFLNDGTAFDTYIQAKSKDGKTIGIGIEIKYTEQDYQIGKTEKINVNNHDSLYWKTARKSNCFIDADNAVFGSDPFRQIWRNHLLGLSMIQKGIVDEFKSITLFPNGNKHFHDVLPKYVDLLNEEVKQDVFGCTFENYISAIHGTKEFDEWKVWLEKRYVVGIG